MVGYVGRYTSIAIGTNGLPVISYFDSTTQNVKFAKCGNAACSSGNAITTLDKGNNLIQSTSIAIPADGLPIISYIGHVGLKVAKCKNATCSDKEIVLVDILGGLYSAIAISADGLPVITYYDSTNHDLKVAKCGNADCSDKTLTVVDTEGGAYPSIAIGTDGLPIISYWTGTNANLKVAKCNNADCSDKTITTVDSEGWVGKYTSITVPADGLPVISYRDGAALNVAKCGNAACSSGNKITTVDPVGEGNVSATTSIAIGKDGLPIISYGDNKVRVLKAAKCNTASCGAED